MKKVFADINFRKFVLPLAAGMVTFVLTVTLAIVFFNISRNVSENGVLADYKSDNREASQLADISENDEMRGVWVASIGNLNYPSDKGLSKKELQAELDEILETCSEIGFNTIFFQVRPCGDALYKSEVFPQSEYVSGEQGKEADGSFDSLEYLLSKAKDYNISVHAWLNPFRATNGSASKPQLDRSALSENNPARLHPEYTVAFADGKLYYNPGLPEVRELIVSEIKYICENYPGLSGIHIDDYFYPYPSGKAEFEDGEAYEKYGNGQSIADFRRSSVNAFVKSAYEAVKSVSTDLRFGVSPFGIWANKGSDTYITGSESTGLEAYSTLYCDAIAWARGGYVDYLVPQVYWSFETKAAPFDVIARWWNANLDGTGVDLYIGHGAYKAADYAEGEMIRQLEFARALLTCRGSAFYGYADISKNTAGLFDDLKSAFSVAIDYVDESKAENAPKEPEITFPIENTTTEDSTYLLGVSDPNYPVVINGEPISRTKDGYFSIYKTLSNGKNEFLIQSKDETKSYTITKLASPDNSANATEMKTYEILNEYPKGEVWLSLGDTIKVSCNAPAGSMVTAKIGGIAIELKPTKYSSTTAKNYTELYEGSVKLQASYAKAGDIASLGTLTFTAQKGNKTATKRAALVNELGKGALIYAEVKNDYSYLKVEPDSSFYDDPTPASIGMRDYVVGYEGGFYKLRCGYYISENNVRVVKDSALYENRLLGVVVEPNVKDTFNNVENHTDIRFSVTENVPVNVSTLKDKFTVTLYNTGTQMLPECEIKNNPLISSYAIKIQNGNVIYEFTLKEAKNYYGFNTVYDDGMIIFRLNNPQSIHEGDTPLSGKTIIIDAGHGGNDIGAPGPASIGAKLHEADLNLSIALELRNKLAALGARVIMTREKDETLDLYDRIDILASMIPDMAISVHHNSISGSVNPSLVRGYLGLYSDCAGIMLADAVADSVTTQLARLKRPTAYQMLAVARNHRFPSTLCEMSFICNVEEFQWTVSPGNYERSAQALADGILDFYKEQAKYLEY